MISRLRHKILQAFLFAILLFSYQISIACNKGSVILNSSTCNPDGTVTYVFDMCLQYNGLEGNPSSFNFVFTGATVTSATPTSVTNDGGDVYNLQGGGVGTSTVEWETSAMVVTNPGNTKCWQITITTNQAATSFTNYRHHTYSNCGENTDVNLPACPVACDPTWTAPADLCSDGSTVNLDGLVSGDAGGTWSGTGVSGSTFDPTGLDGTYSITYTLASCDESHDITVHHADPAWTPSDMCESDGMVNLATVITGDAGGTWSGTGMTGSVFDPTGLSGAISITYSVNDNGCTDQSQQTINVDAAVNPSWATTTICESDGQINLNSQITGTTGGTWSGSGVSGGTFDPSGLSGPIAITYNVVNGLCSDQSVQNITVDAAVDATWNSTTHCVSSGILDLTTLETATTGGSWSGTGVSGTNFDPTGLSGTVSLTYNVFNGSCTDQLIQDITVTTNPDASWDTTTLCESSGNIDLTTLVTGDPGGTWTGTGITGTLFDPTGLSGDIAVTYTVGSGACMDQIQQNLLVHASVDASWTPNTFCEGDGLINLGNLISGTTGGTWSGTGVSGVSLDPTGLSGNVAITYTVGNGNCTDQSLKNVIIDPSVNASWNTITHCESQGVLDLRGLVTGDFGGTWSGTGVSGNNFDPTGLTGAISLTYSITGGTCSDQMTQNVTVTNTPDATWTTTNFCQGDAVISLNTLVTGDLGGTWTGNGVSGNNFDPSAVIGNVNLKYVIGNATCGDSLSQYIKVNPLPNPAWNFSTTICDDNAIVNLDNYVIGATGGTWSGSAVTGSNFDPTGLSGNYPVKYVVTDANGCKDSLTRNISVLSRPSSEWRDTSICAGSGTINLDNQLEPGTSTFGTWGGGSFINGSTFDPSSQSGAIPVTYSVGGTCFSSTTYNITVDSMPSGFFRDTTLCTLDNSFDINDLLEGESGGTFSGVTGVTHPNFDPNGLDGNYSVTYNVTIGLCSNSHTATFDVVDTPDPAWTTTSLCTSDNPIELDSLVTGLSGGTWSGTGVTGSSFNPSGLSGPISIDYLVGPTGCTANLSQDIQVDAMPTSLHSDTTICESTGTIDLDQLIHDAFDPSWSGANLTNSTFDPDGNIGTNTFTFAKTNGTCIQSFQSSVTVYPPPSAQWEAPTRLINNKEQPILLTPYILSGSDANGVWSGEGMSSDGYFNPYNLKGNYEITYQVGDENCGSTVTDIIQVYADFSIFFSNAFSPNGDGINDEFVPLGNYEDVLDYKFGVYNRWGELLFETNEKFVGWDGETGYNNSKEGIMSAYKYKVTFHDVTGVDHKFTGSFMLVR